MPFVAVVTLIAVGLAVAAIAIYLTAVAFGLHGVNKRLVRINAGLEKVTEKTEPVGAVVGEINHDLSGLDRSLQGILNKPRQQQAQPGRSGTPAYVVATPGGGAHGHRSGTLPQIGVTRRVAAKPVGAVVSGTGNVQGGGGPQTVSALAAMQSSGESRPADVRWGVQSSLGVRGISQSFAALAGLVYVGIGVIGFLITGFENFTEGPGVRLFWVFHLTPFHNIVHLGVGAVWLIAAFALTKPAAEGVNFAIGGVYVLAAILGYLGYLHFLGVHPYLDPDNFLHLITGVLSLLFSGVIRAPARAPSSPARPTAALR